MFNLYSIGSRAKNQFLRFQRQRRTKLNAAQERSRKEPHELRDSEALGADYSASQSARAAHSRISLNSNVGEASSPSTYVNEETIPSVQSRHPSSSLDGPLEVEFWSLSSPLVLATLAPKLTETINLLVTACYRAQVAVFNEHSSASGPPKAVGEALKRHRRRLQSLWGDGTILPSILWSLRQVENIASDLSFLEKVIAEGRTREQLKPLVKDSARKANNSSLRTKELLQREVEIVEDWNKKVEGVILLYLINKQRRKRNGVNVPKSTTRSPPNNTTRSSVALATSTVFLDGPEDSEGVKATKSATAHHATLNEHLRSLANFWEDQDHLLEQIITGRVTMATNELKEYAAEWQEARVASRQAIRAIALAVDAYIKPTRSGLQ